MIGILFTLFLIHSTLSQEAKIDIEHIGYGKTSREAKFNIRNVGDVLITNISIFVDGKYHRSVKGLYEPSKGFETTLYLDPGEHTVEVKSNGASDSLSLTISSAKERPRTTPEEETTLLQEIGPVWIIVGILIIIVIFVVVIWLLIRKPKLEKEESQLP